MVSWLPGGWVDKKVKDASLLMRYESGQFLVGMPWSLPVAMRHVLVDYFLASRMVWLFKAVFGCQIVSMT